MDCQMSPADALGYAVLYAVARRIARTSASDPAAASADYQAHAAGMSAEEVREFDKAIVGFVLQLEGKG